ncbi:DJ-1/PfpI family protein [Natranaerofaba carboxydovora]|uniref:DJ-1/PfpI family protein n=1 Tax=Natranaerofaba carboxydovora TaxID=2742683 RepID=UPI001F12C2B7|nr:DJ-1/PfpI family protein [Natranaerofaba carboxydovora]UMZ74467.1 Isonitrile hydratase [Natranaerofaba carboxydovora]
MKLGFVIFEGMTSLDFVGAYDPIVRLKGMGFVEDFDFDIISHSKDEIRDINGLCFKPDKMGTDLGQYDMLIIPGGLKAKEFTGDKDFVEWIKTAKDCKQLVSVCTGSLILGAAGFLHDKRATTHPDYFDLLKDYCKESLNERIVDEGEIITARGVTSSIDVGLYICEKIAGHEVKEKIRKRMDYQT